jgi:YesN/AraC family two-component response regulator
MLEEYKNSLAEGTLIYNSADNCLELNGYELRSDDNIEVTILGSWIPGRIAVDHHGWYLITQDHVGIRLHSGLSARICEQDTPDPLVTQPEPPPHILLVDDDAALLQALPRTVSLRMPEAMVETCQTGQMALEFLQNQHYDAIVSDIKLPDIDGLTLLAKIHELQPDIPILLITAHGEHELAIRALRGGAYDYILKPIERDSFIAALWRAIQTFRLRRKVEEQQQALELHTRSLEITVQQRTQELIEANEIKDKVLGIVSHELRIPLTRLKEIAHLLQDKIEGAGTAETVSQRFVEIEQSIASIERLIQELQHSPQIETSLFIAQHQHQD